MVGVFLHKEAAEMLTGVHPPVEEDEALRAEVVEIANRAKDTQRRASDLANEVIDRVFQRKREVLGLGSAVHVVVARREKRRRPVGSADLCRISKRRVDHGPELGIVPGQHDRLERLRVEEVQL
jgi:hypothetical protein